MPSGNGSVHHTVSLVLVKVKALSTLCASRFYNVFLCAAALLCQRVLAPMHHTLPTLMLSPSLPKHLAVSTSVDKSFTSLCLRLPLDCELHEKPFRSHAQHLAPHLVHNKCPINVYRTSAWVSATWGRWNRAYCWNRSLGNIIGMLNLSCFTKDLKQLEIRTMCTKKNKN